jgi:hypothetical protein
MTLCKHGELESACEDCETERIELDNFRLREENKKLILQRDAWKEISEHIYGNLRAAMFSDDLDYPVNGALDAWAVGRHPIIGC